MLEPAGSIVDKGPADPDSENQPRFGGGPCIFDYPRPVGLLFPEFGSTQLEYVNSSARPALLFDFNDAPIMQALDLHRDRSCASLGTHLASGEIVWCLDVVRS